MDTVWSDFWRWTVIIFSLFTLLYFFLRGSWPPAQPRGFHLFRVQQPWSSSLSWGTDDHWAGPKEHMGQASVGQTALKKDTEKQPLRSLELIWSSREAQEKAKIETYRSQSGNWCSFLAPYSLVPCSGQTFHYSSHCHMLPWALRRWSGGLKEKGLLLWLPSSVFSFCPPVL